MPVVFIFILCLLVPYVAQCEPWEMVAQDLEINHQSVSPIAAFDTSLLFVRTKLQKYELKIVRAKDYGAEVLPVKELVLKSGAIAGINAHFFDEKNRPLGLLVRNSKIENPKHNGGNTLSGIFVRLASGMRVLSRTDGQVSNAILAVQAGPRLLSAGSNIPGLDVTSSLARRSGLCIDNKQRLILFSSKEAFGGISLSELSRYLKAEPYNCTEALNLDGGSSSQIYIKQARKVIFDEQGDPIPVALVLKPILSAS